MTGPREASATGLALRMLPIELALVLAIAWFPFPDAVPIAIPLLIAASVARWVRGRSWDELVIGGRDRVVGGVIVGAAAVAIATPLFGSFGVTAVEWWLVPTARGDLVGVVVAIAMVIALSVAMELVLRGWIVERVLEVSPGPSALPIVVGAVIEALVTPGGPAGRIGAALFGVGLGTIYVASGRSVVTPAIARATFAVGTVVLEATHVLG